MVNLPPSSSHAAPQAHGFFYQEITDYLHQAVPLQPPLRVEGCPPFLHIYLASAHLYAIAQILPQIEAALLSLSGSKCWEIYIYLESELPIRARLIHHRLLERPALSPSVGITASATPLALSPTKAVLLPPIVCDEQQSSAGGEAAQPPVDKIDQPGEASRFRDRVRQRAKANRRKQAVLGTIVIGLVSFGLGSMVSVGAGLRRSLTPSSTNSLTSTPATASQDSQPPPTTELGPDSAANFDEPLEAAEGQLLQPMTPTSGITAAANLLTVPPAIQPAVELKAVGDIIPGTNFPDYRIPDPNYLFNSVKMFMGEVDILFGNFESTLTDYPYSAKDISRGMTFAFRTPPAFAGVLREAGFHVLSVANNHAFDFGDQGFADTIAHIEQAGMRAVGRKGEIVTVDANGYQVAFIGFSYWDDHNNLNDLDSAIALVQTAQAQADMVVISVHAGAEGTDALRVQNRTEYFFSENRGNMVQFSRTMIDAGADLILGHGPHVPRAIELYQNKLIAYSLGNFVGYRTLSTVGPLGKSLILQVELNPEGDFLRGRIIPVALDPNGIPYIDDFFESVTLIRQLTLEDFPDTALTIDQMGYILRTE